MDNNQEFITNCRLKLSRQNQYEFSFASDLGTRKEQEDYLGIISFENSISACICDGMGGLDCGALASEIAVNQLIDEIDNVDFNAIDNSPDFYLDILDKLDNAVHQMKYPDGRRINAGSTLVSVFIERKKLRWLAVGDSSIFLIRNGSACQINKFHNYQAKLDDQLSKGLITETDYKEESHRGHALTSYIGIGGISLFDASKMPIELESEDIVLLCSDGITGYISQNDLADIIHGYNAKKAVDRLMGFLSEKSRGKSQDNATIILIIIN